MTPGSSGDNHAVVVAGIGFVGSLPPSDHPALLAILRTTGAVPPGPLSRADLRRHHRHRELWGSTRWWRLPIPANLHAKLWAWTRPWPVARGHLAELAARLARGHPRDCAAVAGLKIAAICKPRWVADSPIVTSTVSGPPDLRARPGELTNSR